MLIVLAATTSPRAAFPGLNGKILFQRQSGGQTDQVVMNADGTGVTQITFGGSDWYASWSPDGRRIAFSSARTGDFEIYVMNADGSGVTRLTFTRGERTRAAHVRSNPGRPACLVAGRDEAGVYERA